MNPVFVIGVFLAGALLWLLLSFMYKPIGWVGKRLVEDAQREIMAEDNTKKNNKRKRRK